MKKNRVFSIIAVLLISLTFLVGCGGDPIAGDLTNYIDKDLPTIAAAEDKVTNTFNSVLNDKTSGDDVLLAALNNEVIPYSDALIETAKAVVTKTDELKAVHEKYISAMTTQNEGMKKLAEAIENKSDMSMVEEANTLLADAEAQSKAFLEALDALAKDNGIVIQ